MVKCLPGTVRSVTVESGDRYKSEFDCETRMTHVGCDGEYDVFVAEVPTTTRRLKYRFRVAVGSFGTVRRRQPGRFRAVSFLPNRPGLYWFGELGIARDPDAAGVFQLPYVCARDVFNPPSWVYSTVCYQIFPDRFSNGDPSLTPVDADPWDASPTPLNRLGGDLRGIRHRLPYLQKLGINLIYLTPIFKAPSNHKYDTTDYFAIDEQFGTKEELRRLVAEAHEVGIRVVLDAVFNHCGAGFAPFQDVLKNGRTSNYWDWFFIRGDTVDMTAVNYETFANRVANMPKLNIANPEVEAYLLKVAVHWITECDIDGWRLDVANEIDHVFWRKFRSVVKAAKPDALIIGEIWHNSLPWLRGDQFDGVMNYLFRDLTLSGLVDRQLDARRLAGRLTKLLYLYPDAAIQSQFNLLGSHDTERLRTHAHGDREAVLQAFALQFLFPGIPMIYYGDEVGMEGGNDPGCRAGMVWNEEQQDATSLEGIRQLAWLKRQHPALHGGWARFWAQRDVLFCERIGQDSSSLRAAWNLGHKPLPITRSPVRVLFATRENALQENRLMPGACVIWE
ncbi:glycoside hydrolase family 13 protein [Alicyclobacillus herbarius]|uniref:glycoside hydrolase family 13 protein n=1 Tax=Alicyclobacillus herbarius TaxID=122960 RepID=UPI002353E2B1|nr:glycoside hydrolase family 13 protein [Alicyclobacillus herbarius]